MNRSEAWKENANIIEEALGLKKNSIKNSMQAEQRALKKNT
jgi:malate synthase